MNSEQHVSALGFTKKSFPTGTHMCLIYSDDDERREVIGRFLECGIVGKERVSYFADSLTPEEVREWLLKMGIQLPLEDAFSILVAEETYCPDRRFVPDTMLHTLRTFYDRAMDAGYPSARISGEMSWALRGIPGSDRLMEYEALVNEVLVTHPVTAICQYDCNRFGGAAILDVLKVHPMMIVHGQVVQNPYYMKPSDLLGRQQARP